MRTLLKQLKKIFWTSTNWEEDYLSKSTDHADLERRIRQLDRGEIKAGPFGYIKQYNRF